MVRDNKTVKVQFVCDFGKTISESAPVWAGFGVQAPGATTMGPGRFYIGRSDKLNVEARSVRVRLCESSGSRSCEHVCICVFEHLSICSCVSIWAFEHLSI